MNVLGIDTSTAASAVCVVRGDGRAFEVEPSLESLARAPAHSRDLMPGVARCLERAELGYADLDLLAVGVGPGAFTGLRIGVAAARGLAHAHGTRLRAVSSLEALAAGIEEPLALPLIDARRGELFAALYEHGRLLVEPFAAAPDEVARRIAGHGRSPLAAGDGSLRFRDTLHRAGVRVAPSGARAHVVRAAAICRLAIADRAASGAAALPEYIRLPDAKPL